MDVVARIEKCGHVLGKVSAPVVIADCGQVGLSEPHRAALRRTQVAVVAMCRVQLSGGRIGVRMPEPAAKRARITPPTGLRFAPNVRALAHAHALAQSDLICT
jgi:hypothetical protein